MRKGEGMSLGVGAEGGALAGRVCERTIRVSLLWVGSVLLR